MSEALPAHGDALNGEPECQIAQEPARERLWSKNFVLVVLTVLGSSLGVQFLMPTLPLYMKGLGARDAELGLIFGIYSISALLSRLLTGRALDLWGRKRPLVIGAFLYFLAMPLYYLTTTVPSILLLRFFHGLGFGMVTTACSAMAADLAPGHRRGEALGYYGNAQSLAMAVGSAIALWLIAVPGLPLSGFSLLFFACSVVAALELLFSLFINETRQRVPETSAVVGGGGLASFFSLDALPMAVTMLFGAFAAGAVMSFVPIYFSTVYPENVAVFFFAYAAVMVFSRPFVGMLADRINRRLVVIPLMALCAAGVSMLVFRPSLPMVLAAALVYGIGFGSLNPVLLALVVDVVPPHKRGAALATFIASMDIGIATGSMTLGLVAEASGYRSVFPIAGAVVAAGLVYFLVSNRSRLGSRAAPEPVPAESLSTD